ncbi:NRAMP family divalent metal transporter [Halocatena salina]|uniref:Divalent metal cation transporter n=1 Tax=Halocatena salina TaxID=2934340 RepID=A0A8U0A5J0_9EURY|nr:divalent metal cation transporter [Halocatena salina]UPM43177.1 divalent metal cation transporter [Halocatena salina]
MISNWWRFPSWLPVQRSKAIIDAYGLGLLFSANVFGAGSVYILSNTGANFGFTLLWTLPLALFVDMGMHEMSGRLATIDKPLMEYIRNTIGTGPSKVVSVGLAFIMHFWAISNYAVAGTALVWLTPINNTYLGMILAAGSGIAILELRVYDRIEAAITTLIFAVFGIYLVLVFGINLPVQQVATGLVPALTSDIGYLVTIVGLFGTTVYYPNFFIQSSIRPTKGWTEMALYRRDNFVGITFVILLSIAVISVSAAVLEPGTPTLTSPGTPLASILGSTALTVFVFAVFLASFTSATGTLFGAGFLVPQAWGYTTVFGDYLFRRIVQALIVLSVIFAILLLEVTDMSTVRLALVMPAVNGLIGLPITALALYFANRKFFDHPLLLRIYFALLVGLMFVLGLLTAQGLHGQIIHWI